MNHHPLVILGGMGPQASVRFQQLILQKSEPHHAGNGDQYPYVVHYSLPVRDFISDAANQPGAAAALGQLADPINRLHPSCITLACNTAHLLVPQVPYLQGRPFLSMISVVADHVKACGLRRIGLVATPATLESKLYETALAARGITTIRPNAAQTATLEQAIREVIAGRQTTQTKGKLQRIAESLETRGAQAILLGCTELPLAFAGTRLPIPALDCLDLYATAAVTEYYLYNKEQL
jgi:aspartate racemase